MPTTRELTPDDAPAVTTLYRDYGWWDDRTEPDVRRALADSDVAVGVVEERGQDEQVQHDDRLLAAARVLTDGVYYAIVYDVIVAADRRGEGLGTTLLEAVLAHPDLQSVDGLSLLAREGLVPFYESVGFERFERTVDLPEGGAERLHRMVYERDGCGAE